ncbi:MAG TPA: sodium-independent anion transporter [Candidatus Limnocylindrales bacterium]|nr:sodium-independent anion transporter [Candidatus Limnocylindrales bacterium]
MNVSTSADGLGRAGLRRLLPSRADLVAMLRQPRTDVAAGLTVAIVALPLALGFGVSSGLGAAAGLATAIVAGGLAIRKIASASTLEHVPLDVSDHHAEEAALLREHIVAYRFDGPLFFAAAHRFLLELSEVAEVRVVILRMSRVSAIDGTGALVLRDAIERLEHRGITVYLSGVPACHLKTMDALAVPDRLREQGRVFAHTAQAIAAARDLLRDTGVIAPASPRDLRHDVRRDLVANAARTTR